MYTSAKLTQASDRLIAIHGIAQVIQEDQRALGYLAGLWRHHLPFDLLWYLKARPQEKPKEHRAPSWSWGVIDGEVCGPNLTFLLTYERSSCKILYQSEIISWKIEESSAGIFHGYLDLKCPLLLRVSKVTPSRTQQGLALIVQGTTRQFEVEFVPDYVPLHPPSKLFCAELLRIASCHRYLQRWSLWSHGIVLRRADAAMLEVSPIRHERVGRFWVEWQMSDEIVSEHADRLAHRSRSMNSLSDFLAARQNSGRESFGDQGYEEIRVV
jgi:hypothetical protein